MMENKVPGRGLRCKETLEPTVADIGLIGRYKKNIFGQRPEHEVGSKKADYLEHPRCHIEVVLITYINV